MRPEQFPFCIYYDIIHLEVIKIILKYLVTKNDIDQKVSNILKTKLNISSRLIAKLKNNHKILVNGNSVFTSYEVKEGDIVEVLIDFEETDFIVPEKMDLEILYEDEYLLAVNKPAGIVVHPSSYHLNNTLANGVKYYLSNNKKIRPINRLDRDTSGIVLFAKNEYIQECFTKIRPYKEYIAIIDGKMTPRSGTINAPIARKEGSIMEREVSETGQVAITHYETIKEFSDYSVMKVTIETGRTHQIRVHFAFNGHSILGDTLYGKETNLISRQSLHAYKLCFKHPITNEEITITAPIPNDMQNIL
ncbi:MAG: RluA family pseudouridine synthase [Clostridia bacterium]|nr:RluA family pseudouridine synthase [Clostridia bacterium]